MAVEGIRVEREVRGGHLMGRQSGDSPMGAVSVGAGNSGGEWDDSLWSLSCTESEDQSSEANAPASGLYQSNQPDM